MKLRRVFGTSTVVVAALAVTIPAVAVADAPSMSVSVSGSTVTISGKCPKGGTDAEGWFGKPNGHEPIRTGKMKNNKGKLSITFSGVPSGSYEAVMGCQTASDTAVKKFTVAAKKSAAKKKPKGAAKTGGGPLTVWLPR